MPLSSEETSPMILRLFVALALTLANLAVVYLEKIYLFLLLDFLVLVTLYYPFEHP
jgi:hypothetical protein